MDFSLPAHVEEFRDELRTWLAEHLTDDIVAASKHIGDDPAAFEIVRDWNLTMADAGWGAVSWPEEYGGRGAGPLEQLVYVEETVRARAPLPVNIIGLNNIGPAIMHYGTPEQKRTLLPRMVRADDIWCQGMSEPDSGSDLASLRTRALRVGEEYVVTGQKIWTSLAQRAHWCQLFVRTDPAAPKHQGISCLIVNMRRPGIKVRPLTTLTGEAEFAEIFLDEVRVPRTALLGPVHQGWQVATTTLGHERANAARLYSELQVRLDDLVVDLDETGGDGDAPWTIRTPCIDSGRWQYGSHFSKTFAAERFRRRWQAATRSVRPASPRPYGASWAKIWPRSVSMCSVRMPPAASGRKCGWPHAP